MPWLAVEKEYAFDGPGGRASLLDLFEGRRQLIVYRAFFEPGVYRLARPRLPRLFPGGRSGRPRRPPERPRHHARLRLARAAAGHRAGEGADGRDDALVHHDRRVRHRLRRGRMARHERVHPRRRQVFRTYFINNRGDEAMGSTWSYLDMTALGRQEEWEDSPEGYPQTPPYEWWNWHDEYGDAELSQGWLAKLAEAAATAPGNDNEG